MYRRKRIFIHLIFSCFVTFISCHNQAIIGDNDVKIIRDNFGVPHIYANNTFNLFYGYGYAVAQDRLFQMEMIKRSTTGSVSEVLGKDYLQFDKDVRTNLNLTSIKKQYQALGKEDKNIFEGYAKGMNVWIDSIKENPDSLMPLQFVDFEMKPTYWTPVDVIIVFVGTMCNRYSDFNSEIENLQFLQSLEKKHGSSKAKQIYNQLLWQYDADALTTISKKNESGDISKNTDILYHHLKTVNENSIYQKTEKFLNLKSGKLALLSNEEHYKERLKEMGASGLQGAGGYPSCSNIVVIGKKIAKNANAIILNGPQFGWFTPSYVYGIGLHGAGYNLVGNTPFGYPAVLFGNNENIGWGATAGFGDLVDIFEEQLDKSNLENYHFNEKYVPMEMSMDTINIKNDSSYVLKKYRTIHGNVIAWDKTNLIAYSKKRSWEGFEVETLMGWIHSMKAKNYSEWNDQAAKMAISINWYYADKLGNIGYVHTGKIPKRNHNISYGLPSLGNGTMEWVGLTPFKKNPQVYNPSKGFIANWNNAPKENYNSPDMYWLKWTKADRVAILVDEINKAKEITPTDLKDMMQRASFKDVNYEHFVPLFEKYLKNIPLTDNERTLFDLIKQWDGYHLDFNNDEKYDAIGFTVFTAYLEILQEEVFKNDIPAPFFNWYSSTGYRQPNKAVNSSGSNIQPGSKALFKVLASTNIEPNTYDFLNGKSKSEILKKCLSQAFTNISNKFNSNDPTKWLSPIAKTYYLTSNFLGIPQANSNELKTNSFAMNRGTENNLIIFNTQEIENYDVVSPGQSGFIDPKGKKNKHYENQLKMYEEFQYKKNTFSFFKDSNNIESIEYLKVK